MPEKKKPTVLITNDDGIEAPGLRILWEAVRSHANATIVAPFFDQSGMGLSITSRSPLQMEKVDWGVGNSSIWKVSGTPADCVKLGLKVLFKEQKPDLVLSGINRGSNAGRCVLYSGTVGATIEAAFRKVGGIAFSFADPERTSVALAKQYIYPIVLYALAHPPSPGTILNVNFPSEDVEFKGITLSHQGRSYWEDHPDARIHPEGNPYYWLGGKWVDHEEDERSDVFLLKQGYITITPIHVERLTDLDLLEKKSSDFMAHFKEFHPFS